MNNNDNTGTYDIESVQKDQRDVINEVKRDLNTFISNIEVGDLVDGIDSNGSWRMSKVVRRDEKLVELEFAGWEEKWNEKIQLTGGKVKPFRSETSHDTSSSKGAFRGKEAHLVKEIMQVRGF